MIVECIKCHRNRSDAHMQQAVFRNFGGDEPAGLWKCSSNASCAKARKTCPKCGHYRRLHNTAIKLTGRVVYECDYPVGMGDWCGCEEKF